MVATLFQCHATILLYGRIGSCVLVISPEILKQLGEPSPLHLAWLGLPEYTDSLEQQVREAGPSLLKKTRGLKSVQKRSYNKLLKVLCLRTLTRAMSYCYIKGSGCYVLGLMLYLLMTTRHLNYIGSDVTYLRYFHTVLFWLCM